MRIETVGRVNEPGGKQETREESEKEPFRRLRVHDTVRIVSLGGTFEIPDCRIFGRLSADPVGLPEIRYVLRKSSRFTSENSHLGPR